MKKNLRLAGEFETRGAEAVVGPQRLIRTFELGLSKGLMLLVVSFETPGK
jgi:hypothetical protein